MRTKKDMGEIKCDLLCFQQCSKTYEDMVKRQNSIEKPKKLSLKKSNQLKTSQ